MEEVLQKFFDNNKQYHIQNGDCLEVMNQIPDKSIDMILCDLPYGVLNKSNKNAKWDSQINTDELWKHYNRIIKDNGAIVLFAQGMFTANLMKSNEKMWRYNLIWDKNSPSQFLNANRMPLRRHEDICVFYKKLPVYNPQMVKCPPHKRNHGRGNLKEMSSNNCYGSYKDLPTKMSDEKFPTSIILIPKEHKNGSFFHPTQKPVLLLEWLIKTYTNMGGIVLDNCMGSGSTGVAAININRRFIGIELEEKYFNIAQNRIIGALNERFENTTIQTNPIE